MKIIFLLILIVVLPVTSKGQPVTLPDAEVAAKIDGRVINADEFFDMLLIYRQNGDMRKTLKTLTEEGKEEILNGLVLQKLYALEAEERGIDCDSRVRQAIQNATDKVLAEFLLKREISRLDLSDSGLMQFYNANSELFMSKKRIKTRHVNTQTKEEAQAALKEIEKGRDFAEVAAERNIDSSKSKGGDLGWVMPGVMVKPFEDALFRLKQGQISDIVQTNFGFHIIKAEAVDEGTLRSFESVQDEVKNQIINQHLTQLRQMLEKKYPVQINKELLQKIK